MKTPASSLLCGLILASFLALATLAQAGEPIPGIDVKLSKNPGGAIVAHGKTDTKGQVAFVNLAPGDYVVSFVEPQSVPETNSSGQQRAPISTSRSNKKHGRAIIDIACKAEHAKSSKWTPIAARPQNNLPSQRALTASTSGGEPTSFTFTVPAGPSQQVLVNLLLPPAQQAREK